MKILVGISKGTKKENVPYKMFIVDVDSIEPTKQTWEELTSTGLSGCANVRVNLGNYKSITQNPLEYLEAEFDLSKIIDTSVQSNEFQIINVYKDDVGVPVLYRTVDLNGEVRIHHISELPYKKSFSIYGDNIEKLPSFVKTLSIKDAYDWWSRKDKVKIHNRTTRFVYDNFETFEDMPVQLLYHYLVGVKGFHLGYHTITDLKEDYKDNEKLHEYFLFKNTANIKLSEIISESETDSIGEVSIFGNKDPYPDKRKIGYFGAIMSLICERRNYPTFDIYSRPTSEANYDKEGIEATIDLTDGNMCVYNKYEESGCISLKWRIGETQNFFGVTLANLLTAKIGKLSKKFQNEKERVEDGHWSTINTKEWFHVMAFALSTQYYSKELIYELKEILNDYQSLFSKKLSKMIERISAKDSLETMKWAAENIERDMLEISYVKEDGSIQNSNITLEQMKNLFTFKKNNLNLPDWLQIYSVDTIEQLGGVDYLNQFIATRGADSAKLFLSIWAEKLENDQKYRANEVKKPIDRLDTQVDNKKNKK